MDTRKICVSPIWNESISWNTHDPYITECFKHLILVVGSCGVLWIVAPFEFVKIYRYRGFPAPWSTLSIAKISCKALLLVICVVELVKEIYAYTAHIKDGLDGLISAVAFLVTIVLTVVLTLMCKRKGLRSSIALPSFWMISTITTVITIYDDIYGVEKNNLVSMVSLVDDCTVFVISLIQLILSNIPEKGTNIHGRELMNYCPLDGSPLASRLTFSWLNKVLASSVKKTLRLDDLIPLCSEFRSFVVSNKFSEIWNHSEFSREYSELSSYITEEQRRGSDDFNGSQEEIESLYDERKRSLFKCLLKISSQYLLMSSFFEILYTILYFLPVYILSLLLNNTHEPEWHFYVYIAALFVILLLSAFVDSQRKYYGITSAFKVKTAVMNAVFEKALLSQNLETATSHLQEDSEIVFQMTCLVNEVWGAPVRILLGLYLFWLFLGSPSFIGIGAGASLIPLVVLIGSIASQFKTKALLLKSEWLNVLSESLHGIRSLKMYAWEDVLLRKIKTLRNTEIGKLKKARFMRIVYQIILLCSTSLVSLAAFTVFVITTDSFDMRMIFLAYALICLLKAPFGKVLRLLAHFVQGLSSIAKIQAFLDTKEVEPFSQSVTASECRIILRNTTFTWPGKTDFRLENITLNIGGNCLIAVVGDSRSGKSSLLRAMLGEMKKVNGTATINGEVAFVSDSSWIQNTTLEENILFGKRKAETFYRNVLESCDLLEDLEGLPLGDETQIGEKGYSLNRDQKLKIDLARAVYQNANIYLIDDLFRCTDSYTSKQLFEKVIGHRGILCNKIRIFTTCDVELLQFVDKIIFLEDGKISEVGNISELETKEGRFAEYLKNYRHPKFPKKSEKCSVHEKSNCLEHYKCNCDPWYSETVFSLKLEMDSFMQRETTAPKTLPRKILNYTQMNGYFFTITAIVTAILANCCEVGSLSWWAWHTSEHEEEERMYTDIYIYAGFVLLQVFFCTICGVVISCGNTIAVRKFYDWLLNRIMKAPLQTFSSTFAERVLRSFDVDLQYADEDIPVGIFVWLVTIFRAPALLLAVFLHFPVLTLFFIYVIGTTYFMHVYYTSAWRQLHRLNTSTLFPLFNFVQNTFQGISNIRASKASIRFMTRFQSKLDDHNKCNFLFLVLSKWLSNSIEIIGTILIVFVASVFIYRKGQGNYLTGLALVFTLQVPECLIALVYIGSILDINLSFLERFTSFSNVKQEGEFESLTSNFCLSSGSLIIRNLSSAYGEGLYPVLNNISLAIRPREKVAIVGKEDSGITTIFDSLLRIREISEGNIFIDNVDISQVDLHNLRSKMGVIPQDPFIFTATVKENLDPENLYTNEELQSLITKVNLDSSLSDLSNVIDSNISCEDKEKIALIRCLLKMSKLVIIDGTEASVKAVAYFQDSTVISFGNSQALSNYDRIINISSGEIVGVNSVAA